MKKWLGLVAILVGCASVPNEVSIDQIDRRLDRLEQSLDQERWEPDGGRLQTLQTQARELAASALLSREQRLKTHFFLADVSWLLQDRQQLAEQYRLLQSLGQQFPQTLIVASWLQRERSHELLQEAGPPANSHPRLQWELGLALAAANRHAEAVAAFDRALAGLPDIWKQKGRSIRDTSWSLRQTPTGNQELNRLASVAAPTLMQFYQAIRELTPKAADLRFETRDPLTRARLAEWVLHYVAEKRNTPQLRTRQSRRLLARPNPASPIPDVSLDSPYFDAIVFCVERDILALLDGRHFQPDVRVSGSEAVGVVNKVIWDF